MVKGKINVTTIFKNLLADPPPPWIRLCMACIGTFNLRKLAYSNNFIFPPKCAELTPCYFGPKVAFFYFFIVTIFVPICPSESESISWRDIHCEEIKIFIHWPKSGGFLIVTIFVPMPHQIRNGGQGYNDIHCEEIRIFSNIFTPKMAELLNHFPILSPKWRFSNCYDSTPFRSETVVMVCNCI